MDNELASYEEAKTTRLEVAKNRARIFMDEEPLYSGSYDSIGERNFVFFGELLYFPGGTALELWEAVRLVFRKNHVGLVWELVIYHSPFPEDLERVWSGEITAKDFNGYSETSIRKFKAQDGTFPMDGHKRETIFREAIEKLSEVNEGAILTPRLNLTHALLCAVQEYSRCQDGLKALSGLGLEDATELAKAIVAQERLNENSIVIASYRPAVQEITISGIKPSKTKEINS